MRLSIPHNLEREAAKDRLGSRMHEIADHLPGGAEVDISWPDEYLMDMVVRTMRQELHGHVDIKDSEGVIVIDLPPALSFVEGMLGPILQKKGTKLLGSG